MSYYSTGYLSLIYNVWGMSYYSTWHLPMVDILCTRVGGKSHLTHLTPTYHWYPSRLQTVADAPLICALTYKTDQGDK